MVLKDEGAGFRLAGSGLDQVVDGTVVEVFEWRSAEAIQQAHHNPAVQALWAEFGAACDYLRPAELADAQQMFAEFHAVDL